MAKEIEKAYADYQALAKKAANGDLQAKQDKAKAMGEIRQIEREAARAGTILKTKLVGDRVVATEEQTSSKRSLQEEYVRKFDDKAKVRIGGREQTLAQYHRARLLNK
jgi:hypothetical protein